MPATAHHALSLSPTGRAAGIQETSTPLDERSADGIIPVESHSLPASDPGWRSEELLDQHRGTLLRLLSGMPFAILLTALSASPHRASLVRDREPVCMP
jgi:hypothetical protein